MKIWASCAVAVLLTYGAAYAQSTTGTIWGQVTDIQGMPVPGVTITVTSPNLQGTRETLTSANGHYVIPLLPSGVYTVLFGLTGFGAQTHTVSIAPTQMARLDVELGPAKVSETVLVAGRMTNALMDTSHVATSFTQELIANLPTARDIHAALMLSPSVHATGPSGAYSIAGSMSFENLFLVNGVTVNENVRGQAYDLYIEDAIQETTVATGGISAEYGRFGGGVVNIVTKSGGNRFSGSFRDTLNNDNWRRITPFEETVINGLGGRDLRVDKVVPTYEYTLGGPVVRDRLWFFTAGRLQTQESGRTTVVTNIPYTFTETGRRFEYKGTYAVRPGHSVQGSVIRSERTQENNTFNVNLSMDLASLGTRDLPEDLLAWQYTGVVGSNVFVEGRYSSRHQRFINSGSRFTDLEHGTLLVDRSRGNTRYWAETLCGVCDQERRDNENIVVKSSYFLSTAGAGSHTMTLGYDYFNDKRLANAHQSGSDYRILGSSTIIQGTGSSAVIYPQFLGDGSTIIQWNPIRLDSEGSNFRTHSVFYNDSWRVSDRLTANLGLRYDKNDGADQAATVVTTESAWSPRLGFAFDPTGDDRWSITGSVAKYVTAISNTIADSASAAGQPEERQFVYRGPSINPPGTMNPLTADLAIQQVFAWFNANGAENLPLIGTPIIPGVTPVISGSLRSPSAWEYATGVNRQLGSRTAVRADVMYRNYTDFYSDRADTSTGLVRDPDGRPYDLVVIENDDGLAKRRYAGFTVQATTRWNVADIGGNYTLSRTWGNFEGETVTSGPIRFEGGRFPEYKQADWSYPEGDLLTDQRHRAKLWLNYRAALVSGLTLSLLQTLESGVPYGAGGRDVLSGTANTSGVDSRPYVTNPGYIAPPAGNRTSYYYTPRDAFRTETQVRTDFAANYVYRLPGGRGAELFAQVQVINLFNQFQLCACGATAFGTGNAMNAGGVNIQRIDTTVLTPVTTPARFAPFNPFTTTPVQGVNWDYGPNFGRAVNRFAYTTPQSLRLSFGVRF